MINGILKSLTVFLISLSCFAGTAVQSAPSYGKASIAEEQNSQRYALFGNPLAGHAFYHDLIKCGKAVCPKK